MELLVANVNNVVFKIDRDLSEQYGALPLPFQGMDSESTFAQWWWSGSEPLR